MKRFTKIAASLASMFMLWVTIAGVDGCARKEKVIDVETPGGEVEVERDLDTGEVDVTVDTDGDADTNDP